MGPIPERIVLASASGTRAAILRAAGVAFTVEPANLDEAAVKAAIRNAGGSALDCAAKLALEKACIVSNRIAESLVIGADQLLEAGGRWFDKPRDLAEARTQFIALRGSTHRLFTAVAVVRHGVPLWQATSAPELTMRAFTDRFLDKYLAAEGESLLASVGAYRIEGLGSQLFVRINGDHFAVLGLPLLELLGFLRGRGAVQQ